MFLDSIWLRWELITSRLVFVIGISDRKELGKLSLDKELEELI